MFILPYNWRFRCGIFRQGGKFTGKLISEVEKKRIIHALPNTSIMTAGLLELDIQLDI